MSCSLTAAMNNDEIYCFGTWKGFKLPIVDVKQPVEREIEAQGNVDRGGVGRGDRLVERGEHGDHVGHVEQLVVLAAEPVGVERLHSDVQLQQMH